MTATLAARLDTPPTAVDIDRLAVQFLELEQKADEAYKIATELDEPHEKMKEELICLMEEFGSREGRKIETASWPPLRDDGNVRQHHVA